MRIAITGSWRDKDKERWKLRNKAQFFEAMASLGSEFVTLGHRLVVATDSPHTADRAAVDGAVRALPRDGVYDKPVIELLRGDHEAFRALAAKRPGFVNLRSAPPNAEVTKLYQVHLADVVVAVGGAEKTLQAAIAAAVSGKRVVPVGCFGGAAAQAVEVFEATAGGFGANIPSNDSLGPLAVAWAPETQELVLRVLGVRYPRILIVHGRDLKSRDGLFQLLIELGLPQPIVMAAEPTLGRALPEKFEELAVQVDAAIALVTPDDLGGLRDDSEASLRGRARQNVWVEVGWFWGKLGRARTLLLGKKGVELPSDLSGLLVEQFDDQPAEREVEICQWIESLGWPRPARPVPPVLGLADRREGNISQPGDRTDG
jgi:CAP12/Pycsar effector protein, TIR domain